MTGTIHLAMGVLIAVLARGAAAGEIVGSTFVSEKDGVIEVNAEGWSIIDAEKTPGLALNQIARFTPKQQLPGNPPAVDLFRLANPGGAVQAEEMLRQISDSFAAIPGFKTQPIEGSQLGGRRVLVLPVLVEQPGARVHGRVFMMKGDKSLYWAQVFANDAVWAQLQPMVLKLVERTKY